MSGDAADDVLEALDDVVAAVRANVEAERRIVRRAAVIRSARRRGRDYRSIVTVEERPLIVEMLRQNQERLATAGSRFRRAEALALRREGLTLDEIAALFGVTRQRVIALLDDKRGSASAPRPRRPAG